MDFTHPLSNCMLPLTIAESQRIEKNPIDGTLKLVQEVLEHHEYPIGHILKVSHYIKYMLQQETPGEFLNNFELNDFEDLDTYISSKNNNQKIIVSFQYLYLLYKRFNRIKESPGLDWGKKPVQETFTPFKNKKG